MNRCLSILTFSLILAGISPQLVSAASQEVPECREGQFDEQGNLVFHCYHKYAPAVLTTEYGFLVFRNEFSEPKFVLAKRSSKTYETLGTWDDLLGAIKNLPKGSSISIYDRCTVPTFSSYYPLSDKMMAKVKSDFQKVGVTVMDKKVEVCTCDEFGSDARLKAMKMKLGAK